MDASTYSPSVRVHFEAGLGLLTLGFEGRIGWNDLAAARARLASAVGGRPVNAVLIDARRSVAAYSPAELIEAVEQALDEIAPRRCAFVSGEGRSEAVMLIETVSFPYAVRVQAFDEVDPARDWLAAAI